MIGKRTAIWKREEYSYESEERDIPYVISYMHEDGQIRPAMIVVPGGAYRQVSSSEGDIVARTFYGRIQCACTYIQCESDIGRRAFAPSAA